MSVWVGIIFLMSFAGTVGLNDEYFNSEKACWMYFDKHPSFTLVQTYQNNHYQVNAKVKKYEIKEVGMAFVSCKEQMHNQTVSPHDPDKQVPKHEHQHEHGSHNHN